VAIANHTNPLPLSVVVNLSTTSKVAPFGILDPSRALGGAAPRELRLITGTARHS